MISDFKELRKKLDKSIEMYGIHAEKTKKISERYNELVNLYYEREKQYHRDNLMHSNYLKSVKALKKIAKDLVKFPTIKEWNFHAKKNNLLNSESLKYISGNSWHDLRNKISSKL